MVGKKKYWVLHGVLMVVIIVVDLRLQAKDQCEELKMAMRLEVAYVLLQQLCSKQQEMQE